MSQSSELLTEYVQALKGRVEGDLRRDAVSRGLYATDASLYEQLPVAVILPRTVADVEAAVEAAARLGIAVLPRGGGSSLAGQAVNAAVVLDFSRYLDRIIDVDPEAGRVVCQPGITLDALNAHIRGDGWMMGPDPASGNRATLGGMYGNNATGTHSIRYGPMIRHVRSARVVLADGSSVLLCERDEDALREQARPSGLAGRIHDGVLALIRREADTIRKHLPGHWRRNNGYRLETLLDRPANLAQLVCGSEGTLAVATELSLDLVRRPEKTAVGVVHFHRREDSLRAVTAILESDPSAVELFDGAAIRQARASRGFAERMTFVEGDPGAVLLTEYDAAGGVPVSEGLDRLEQIVRDLDGASGLVRLETQEAVGNAWGVRKESLGLLMGVRGDHKPVAFIEDASVPVEHLADYIGRLTALLEETGTRAVMYAHASAGCLHVRPFINTKDADDVAKMKELARGSMELAREYGGWFSSEHGDGIARGWLNEEFLGPELYGLCTQVKQLFDPSGILNPHRVLDTPGMDEHLRTGPEYRTLPLLTDLDFSEEGGFDRAVEQCNGNGACRQRDTGGMCPSFMATREEADSTRGRANILRLALSGRLPEEDFTGDGVYEVLDLCVQCKACKTECPSSVDMAKIKTEWLNQRWRRRRPPVRTRLFAGWPEQARRLCGPLAGPVNRIMGTRAVRWLLDRVLGISMERSLPRLARKPFVGRGAEAAEAGDEDAVVLFADTFHNYQMPDVAADAKAVLEAAGYRVLPVGGVCCGRTYLSKGFVTRAQVRALATVERLYPFAEAGLPVIGLEPSCILTLVDEFGALLPGDPRTEKVSRTAVTFEQFVAAHADRFQGLFVEGGRAILHGHCHQKALTGVAPSIACLEAAGLEVDALDTACCGMAGSFGYEKEHLAISKAMGERRLAPSVREAATATEIVAAGTSCRSQIESLAGRGAHHPAQVMRRRLRG